MAHFHVAQVSLIAPVLSTLEQAGANVDHLLRVSKLDEYCLDDPNKYIPVPRMYALYENISRYEGIDDYLGCFAEQFELASLSQTGEMLAYTPDVLSGCRLVEQINHEFLTNEVMELQIKGPRATLLTRYTDRYAAGRDQTEIISFALVMNGLRIAFGSAWAPLEIHLQCKTMPNLDAVLPPGNNTKIHLGQAQTAVVFPTSMLTLPMLGDENKHQIEHADRLQFSTSVKIEKLLDSMQPERIVNLSHVSESSEIAPRTLQRLLAEEGSSLSMIADGWRFKTALKMLDNAGTMVKDISERLGYSNTSNFERAFRRWTNSTPNQYRELQQLV